MKRILVVDPDRKSRRILEVSLRKAGYECVGVESGRDALDVIERTVVDLVISETELPDWTGFDLCAQVKSTPALEGIPFIFLTHSRDMTDKLRGFEIGVEEYIAKPVYVNEVTTRVQLLLKRREKDLLAEAEAYTVEGSLDEVPLVDICQTVEDARKTGAVRLRTGDRVGTIYFEDGLPIDAKVGRLLGEAAVYRLLAWSDASFTLKYLSSIRRPRRIQTTFSELVLEGLTRLEELEAQAQAFVPLETVFQLDFQRLGGRIERLPEAVREILQLVDGRRSARDVIDDSSMGDLETLRVLRRLADERLIEPNALAHEDEEAATYSGPQDIPPELQAWLGGETDVERDQREERERLRRQEENRLREELEKLRGLKTDVEGRLRSAEVEHRQAIAESRALEERERTIERRLTGDRRKVSTADFPVMRFDDDTGTQSGLPRPADEASLEGASPQQPEALEPGAAPAEAAPDRPSPPTASDTADDSKASPTSDETSRVSNLGASPAERRASGTNPRFRAGLTSVEGREWDTATSRGGPETPRRDPEGSRRRQLERHLLSERERRIGEERQRAEELSRLKAQQQRLEEERRQLLAQRERLQTELRAERGLLEQERARLHEAADLRRRAQEDEAAQLREQIEETRRRREEEARQLQRERETLLSRPTPVIDAEEPAAVAPQRDVPTSELDRVESMSLARRQLIRPADLDAEAQFEAVEAARRRVLEATRAANVEQGQAQNEAPTRRAHSSPTPDVGRSIEDTPQSLAAVAVSRERLAARLADSERAARSPAGEMEPPTRLLRAQTPPSGTPALGAPGAPAASAVLDEGDEFHEFFTEPHDEDLYAALYADEGGRPRGRGLLIVALIVVCVASAAALLLVSGDDQEEDGPQPAALENETPPELSGEELASAREAAGQAGSQTGDRLNQQAVTAVLRQHASQAARALANALAAARAPTQLDAAEGSGLPLDLIQTPDLTIETALAPADDTQGAARQSDSGEGAGDTDLAASARARRNEGDEEGPPGDEEVDVEATLERAGDLMAEHLYGEAAAELRLLLRGAPTNRRAHQLLGECLINLDEASDAVDHLERALRNTTRPDDQALLLLGSAQLEAGDNTGAQVTFRRYIELYPDGSDAQAVRDYLDE